MIQMRLACPRDLPCHRPAVFLLAPGQAARLLDRRAGYVAAANVETIRRILHERGVSWQATKTWKASTDPDFTSKRHRILTSTTTRPPTAGAMRGRVQAAEPARPPRPGLATSRTAGAAEDHYTRDQRVRHMIAALDLATVRPGRLHDLRRVHGGDRRSRTSCHTFPPGFGMTVVVRVAVGRRGVWLHAAACILTEMMPACAPLCRAGSWPRGPAGCRPTPHRLTRLSFCGGPLGFPLPRQPPGVLRGRSRSASGATDARPGGGACGPLRAALIDVQKVLPHKPAVSPASHDNGVRVA